ncbi:MAG: hypothetical protein WKF30_15845 [Pyrinomonadaceae bacterium]
MHIEAGVGFETFAPLFLSHRGRAEEKDVDAQPKPDRADQAPDEPGIFFVFG